MKVFPLTRSVRAAAIWSAVLAVPTLLLSCSILSGFYLVMILVFLMPVALCMAGLCGGALPMGVGAAASLAAMWILAGEKGLALAAAYLLPIVGAFVYLTVRRVPFWKACVSMIGVHIACFAGVYALLQGWSGGRLYQAAGEAAADAVKRWMLGDFLLVELYRLDEIRLTAQQVEEMKQSLRAAQRLFGHVLTEDVRTDMLLSLQSTVSSRLESLVPGVIASQSVLGGVGCLLLPLRIGYVTEEKRQFLAGSASEGTAADEKHAVDFPDLGMPPLRTWFIPRGVGWQVGAALAAGYLMQYSDSSVVTLAGLILYNAAAAVFTVQGLALFNYMQHLRGRKQFWRVFIPLLLLATRIPMILGIFDQAVNIRGLRKPREPKEDI